MKTTMNFEDVLAILRGTATGERGFGRLRWKNVRFISIQKPDAHSKMTAPYLYASTTSEDMIPWNPTAEDMLAEDWYEVKVD